MRYPEEMAIALEDEAIVAEALLTRQDVKTLARRRFVGEGFGPRLPDVDFPVRDYGPRFGHGGMLRLDHGGVDYEPAFSRCRRRIIW
jgi:hypothetical protein